MLDFLKRFGLGIVYVLLSPFIALFLILWALYALIIFFVQLFKSVKSFFSGHKFFEEFPEDIEAKRILELEQYSNNDDSNNLTNNNSQDSTNNDGGNPTL